MVRAQELDVAEALVNLVVNLHLVEVAAEAEAEAVTAGDLKMKCELCGREVTKRYENHHLVPKSNGGLHTATVVLHPICHRQIHALFTNHELASLYNTIERLKGHRDVKRFINWVSKKDIGFDSKTRIRKKNR